MDKNLSILRYESKYKSQWDEFIHNSINGTFILNRDYMEYHKDRFKDFSLLLFSQDELVALFPANIIDNKVHSHQGLTYGGLILKNNNTNYIMLMYDALITFFKNNEIIEVIIRDIPFIYHHSPLATNHYLLFKYGFSLCSRDLSTAIDLNNFKYKSNRKYSLKKAKTLNLDLAIIESTDYDGFFEILSILLKEKFNKKPTHSTNEILKLSKLFSNNISLYLCINNKKDILAGVVVYKSCKVWHAQYIASTNSGKECGAGDLIIDYILKKIPNNIPWFDFGISTTGGGKILNKDLLSYKESWGGQPILYDTYKLKIA